jgi:hypothetical protein
LAAVHPAASPFRLPRKGVSVRLGVSVGWGGKRGDHAVKKLAIAAALSLSATPSLADGTLRCSAPGISEITITDTAWTWRDQSGEPQYEEDENVVTIPAKHDNGTKDLTITIRIESSNERVRPAMFSILKDIGDEGHGDKANILGRCSREDRPEPTAGDRFAAIQPQAKPRPPGDYAVPIYQGCVARPDLGTEFARSYRTRILEAARGRPNFAGKYIVTTWGCGTGCSQGAIIDAQTGKVTGLPSAHSAFGGRMTTHDYAHRADSRLLVITGKLGEEDETWGYHHFAMEGGEFKFIKSVIPKDQ